jgi:predicted amidohydrolase YtcJ
MFWIILKLNRMKKLNKVIIMLLLINIIGSCGSVSSDHKPTHVDLIIYNAKIYTLDSSFSIVESMAIKDREILATGTDSFIKQTYASDKQEDLHGKAIFPGFIDAHSHFIGYGEGLVSRADLVGTISFDEVISRLEVFEQNFSAKWLIGRGWDQNDWENKQFPDKEKLDELWPNKPVYLTRIDGHAAIVNTKALELAGVTAETKIEGGEIILNDRGEPTGVLVDNAMDLVRVFIPKIEEGLKRKAILQAEKDCFAKGLTSVCDAGLEYDEIQLLDEMHKSNQLKMRVYAMLTPTKENLEKLLPKGPYKTDRLNVRSIKLYADGALGSRGACLIHEYHDKPNWKGMMLSHQAYYDSLCSLAYRYGFQVNTHAIGDSANRVMLETYARYLKEKNDKRWRIEHAQVLHPDDFNMFGKFSIIPSVQPTHATSDMYWADERLGEERIKSAYAYEELRKQNGWIPLGTDFPIEKIDPLLTFYAAVARQDLKQYPADGFQMENALSREDALKGITIWAAKAGFEEQEKGSLEVGKYADFIVLDQDIMEVANDAIPQTKVLMTFVDGVLVYSSK